MNSLQVDAARLVAYRVLRDVTADDAYANLALANRLRDAKLGARDAAFATELVSGTARSIGTLDAVIERASGRPLKTLQPAVIDVLRLGTYQALCMRVPPHAAVATSVDLAADQIGRRVSGLVNAVLRRVASSSWDEWLSVLTEQMDDLDALALRTCHPRWIVDAFRDVLPKDELEAALGADNDAPGTTLAVRPGAMTRDALVEATGGSATQYSPWGVLVGGDPAGVSAVQDRSAGVQDEGSQLVVLAASRALETTGTPGAWLDLCAGPGGKSALLRGLSNGALLVANEAQPHRARLVSDALRAYPADGHQVIVADGLEPAWQPDSFAFVLADVPCTGLGSLRRRPEARWRRRPTDVAELSAQQVGLLQAALRVTQAGGTVAYATCSPHRDETASVVTAVADTMGVTILDAPSFLPDVPDCTSVTDARFVQLWPHRHGTDAMFLALLRKAG